MAPEVPGRFLAPSRFPPISIDAGFSVNCPLLNPMVGVAQLVERRSVACTLNTLNALIRHRLFTF